MGLETRREWEPKTAAAVDWLRCLSIHPLTPHEMCTWGQSFWKVFNTNSGVNSTSILSIAAKFVTLLHLRPLTTHCIHTYPPQEESSASTRPAPSLPPPRQQRPVPPNPNPNPLDAEPPEHSRKTTHPNTENYIYVTLSLAQIPLRLLQPLVRIAKPYEIATVYRSSPGSLPPPQPHPDMFSTTGPSRWRTALVGGLMASLSIINGTFAEKTQADYFVHELPGAPQPLLKMHAG